MGTGNLQGFGFRRGPEPLGSTAEFGKGIQGKGMGRDELAAGQAGHACHGEIPAAREEFEEL